MKEIRKALIEIYQAQLRLMDRIPHPDNQTLINGIYSILDAIDVMPDEEVRYLAKYEIKLATQ